MCAHAHTHTHTNTHTHTHTYTHTTHTHTHTAHTAHTHTQHTCARAHARKGKEVRGVVGTYPALLLARLCVPLCNLPICMASDDCLVKRTPDRRRDLALFRRDPQVGLCTTSVGLVDRGKGIEKHLGDLSHGLV
jgi:hypothetical protein